MEENNNIKLDSDIILELINRFPNDMDLGKRIRSYYNRLIERESTEKKDI
jgi:hypothetical protein